MDPLHRLLTPLPLDLPRPRPHGLSLPFVRRQARASHRRRRHECGEFAFHDYSGVERERDSVVVERAWLGFGFGFGLWALAWTWAGAAARLFIQVRSFRRVPYK